jgi:hypothetical protein
MNSTKEGKKKKTINGLKENHIKSSMVSPIGITKN